MNTVQPTMNQRHLVHLSTFASALGLSVVLGCNASSTSSPNATGGSSSGGGAGANTGDPSTGGAAGTPGKGGEAGHGASGPDGSGGMGGGEMGTGGRPTGGGDTNAIGAVRNHCPGEPEDYVLLEGSGAADVLNDEGQPGRAIVGFPGDDTITTSGTPEPGTTCVLGGAGDDVIHLIGSAPDGVGSLVLVGGGGADVLRYEVEGTGNGHGPDEARDTFLFKDFAPGLDKLHIDGDKTHATSLVASSDFTESSDGEHASCTSYVVVLDPADGEVWLSQTCDGVPQNVLLGTLQSKTPPSLSDLDLVFTP